jgi:hypothetical protein
VDVAASARNGGSPAARRVEWSGPYGEEFASDKSASAMTYPAELLTVIVSGTSRRNVLGAIAFEKNDCNFPRRRQPRRIKEARTATTQDSFIRTQKNRRPRQAQPLRKNQEENRFDLTNSFRNGHLDRCAVPRLSWPLRADYSRCRLTSRIAFVLEGNFAGRGCQHADDVAFCIQIGNATIPQKPVSLVWIEVGHGSPGLLPSIPRIAACDPSSRSITSMGPKGL